MEYYAAINRSNSAGESTYFIEFMLRMIRDTLAELVNTQKSETVYLNGEKDSLEGKILVLFASDEHLTAGEAATLLNVSQRQIERAIAALKKKGIDLEEVTLHVGAGTFKPVKSEEIEGHEMHTEYISVNRQMIEKLIAHGGKAVAVGTTSVRTLESLYYIGATVSLHPDASQEELHVSQWQPYDTRPSLTATEALQCISDYMSRHQIDALHTSTQIIIAPGYEYKIVKKMITNFHQPQSTLLLLVSAFVKGDWHTIYDYALAHGFRFLSYGDSSLLIP